MAGTTSIVLMTIGSGDPAKLKDSEELIKILTAAVKASGLKPLGKVFLQAYPPKTVNGRLATVVCSVLVMQCLKTGQAILATTPIEGLVEITISSHEPFKLDDIQKHFAPFSEWAYLVDFAWFNRRDGAWIQHTILDTETKMEANDGR